MKDEFELGEPSVWMKCPVCKHTAFVTLDEWRKCHNLPGYFMCPGVGCRAYMNWDRLEVKGCLQVTNEQKGRKFLNIRE
jgi:hypothetical protein